MTKLSRIPRRNIVRICNQTDNDLKGIVDEYEARVMPFMDMDGVETPKNMDELLAMASRMSEEDEAHFMAGVICTWNLCSTMIDQMVAEDYE
mgnify:CR=1 FL=1